MNTFGNDAHAEANCLQMALGDNSLDEKFEQIMQLPEPSRAKIAEFCYRRVHLRELGLRLVATCQYPSLSRHFGIGARSVQMQATRIHDVVRHLDNGASSRAKRLTLNLH